MITMKKSKKMDIPDQIKDKFMSLPKSSLNNARRIFLNDWERSKGNKSREYYFAQRWGLDYDYMPGFDDGEEPAKSEEESAD